MNTKALIDHFLTQKRIAIIGVSSDPKDFSQALMNEFVKNEFEVSPVNPKLSEIDGVPCYAKVEDIPSKVDAALVMTNKTESERAVQDCHQAGVDLVWLYRSVGAGSVSVEAIEFGKQNDMKIIPGYCPMMFFRNPGFIHKFHRKIMKITGSYPK